MDIKKALKENEMVSSNLFDYQDESLLQIPMYCRDLRMYRINSDIEFLDDIDDFDTLKYVMELLKGEFKDKNYVNGSHILKYNLYNSDLSHEFLDYILKNIIILNEEIFMSNNMELYHRIKTKVSCELLFDFYIKNGKNSYIDLCTNMLDMDFYYNRYFIKTKVLHWYNTLKGQKAYLNTKSEFRIFKVKCGLNFSNVSIMTVYNINKMKKKVYKILRKYNTNAYDQRIEHRYLSNMLCDFIYKLMKYTAGYKALKYLMKLLSINSKFSYINYVNKDFECTRSGSHVLTKIFIDYQHGNKKNLSYNFLRCIFDNINTEYGSLVGDHPKNIFYCGYEPMICDIYNNRLVYNNDEIELLTDFYHNHSTYTYITGCEFILHSWRTHKHRSIPKRDMRFAQFLGRDIKLWYNRYYKKYLKVIGFNILNKFVDRYFDLVIEVACGPLSPLQ